MQEMDLRFWEIHRLAPYLIVQSQYVLVNKWALQVRQKKERKTQGGNTELPLYP